MKTLITLTALLFSFSSFAGINVIDKGGGFAEMLVLKIDNNLSKTIKSCLQSKFCDVSAESAKTLKDLNAVLSSLQLIPLEFTSECSGMIDITEKSITIPSCLLYSVDNEVSSPLTVQTLSELVLSTRLAQGGLSSLDEDSLKRMFVYFYLIDVPHFLDNGTKKIMVHVSEYGSSWYHKEFYLSVETVSETLDITADLQQSLCGNEDLINLKLSFERKVFLSPERFLFEGEAIWECSFPYRHRFKAKLSISGLVGADSKIPQESVTLRLRQRELLPSW